MFKNYLTIAIRNILRQKAYSFINIFGLAIGITCAIFIYLWVYDEVTFDEIFENISDDFLTSSDINIIKKAELKWEKKCCRSLNSTTKR